MLVSIFMCFDNVMADELILQADLLNGKKIGDDNLITCRYEDAKNGMNLSIRLVTNVGPSTDVNPYSVYLQIKGDSKSVFAKDKLLKERGLNIENYLPKQMSCPSFAAMYKKNGDVVFSNDDSSISDALYVLSLKKTKYSDNYCYYKNSGEGTGIFVHKDNLGNLSNDYQGNSCPAGIMVGEEFDKSIGGYYGGANSLEEDEVATLKNRCEQTMNDEYGFDDDPGLFSILGGGIVTNIIKSTTTDDADLCILMPKVDLVSEPDAGGDSLINPSSPIECKDLFDDETKKFIGNAYFVIEIIGILLLIALSIKDYAMIILQSKQDEIKKTHVTLLKRLIIIIIILLLPALVKFTIKTFNIEGFNSNDPLCGTMEKAK